jgi:hypothetical protein
MRPTDMLVVALIAATLAVAGCAGVKESPGGPSGTGAPTIQAKVVPAAVRSAVVKALQRDGVQFDPAAVEVVYGMSHNRVAVTGVLRQPGFGSGDTAPTVLIGRAEIDLTRVGGKWTITGVSP